MPYLLVLLLLAQLLFLLQLLGVNPSHGVLGRLEPNAVGIFLALRALIRGQLSCSNDTVTGKE